MNNQNLENRIADIICNVVYDPEDYEECVIDIHKKTVGMVLETH